MDTNSLKDARLKDRILAVLKRQPNDDKWCTSYYVSSQVDASLGEVKRVLAELVHDRWVDYAFGGSDFKVEGMYGKVAKNLQT